MELDNLDSLLGVWLEDVYMFGTSYHRNVILSVLTFLCNRSEHFSVLCNFAYIALDINQI